MATWYREINPLQEPMGLGRDAGGRAKVGFNVLAIKRPSGTFLEELKEILVDAGFYESTIFLSSAAVLPDPAEGETIMTIVETGGPAPERTQNAEGTAYQRATAQIVARAINYVDAREMARDAYDALATVKNTSI